MIEKKQNEEKDLIEIRVVEKMVSRRFHKYLKVFEKKKLERMPTRKTWNYTINLREGFVSKKEKIYLLSRIKREEVQKFIKNQLRKRYIQLLKSPQTSPVFFILKKNGKKRMVQNYRYLKSWTIKNNYPLPLISDLIDNIEQNVFIKMDLRWDYIICQVYSSGKHISVVHFLPTIKACLPQWLLFLQHALQQCCNHLGILSSMVEILLSTWSSITELPLSVSQHLNPEYLLQQELIYKTSSYTVIHQSDNQQR